MPFGTLVERGLLKPGEVLFDASGRFRAKVRADGTLISAEARGSIHQVGAQVQGAPACNGWAFWHFLHRGQPVLDRRSAPADPGRAGRPRRPGLSAGRFSPRRHGGHGEEGFWAAFAALYSSLSSVTSVSPW